MIKSILPICMILSLSAFAYCDDGGDVSLYVSAKSGLVMRAEASKKSDKLGGIPYGEKVSVLEQSDKTMTVDGKTGHWTLVDFKGQQGWVFGGFLSATPIAKGQNKKSAARASNAERCAGIESCMANCAKQFASEDDYNGVHEACDDGCRKKIGAAIQYCERKLWSQADWEKYDPDGYAELIGQ